MIKLRDVKIRKKLNLILTIVIINIFLGLGFFITIYERNRILKETDAMMQEEVGDLVKMIDIEIRKNQELVNVGLNLAHQYLFSLGQLTESSDETEQFEAVNQITKESEVVAVNKWFINGQPIQNQFQIVDKIKELSVETATIFQKIPKGYLRISTNVMKLDGQRATGTFIPNDSPVIQTIEKGQTYKGRAYVVNDWYLTAYEPIFIDGQIKGILYVGVKEKNLEIIKSLFKNKKYFSNGYPLIINEEGTFLVHPTDEGKNKKEEDFFQQMVDNKSGVNKSEYKWEGEKKIQYYQYYEPIKSFISTTIYEKDLLETIKNIRNVVLLITILGIVIFLLINTYLSNLIISSLHKVMDFAKKLASGNLDVTIDLHQKDEVGELADSLRNMAERLKTTIISVIDNANNLADASKQINVSSQSLSENANQQAASVEEVSSSMEQMVSNIQQNADNAIQTEKISSSAADLMKKMGEKGKQSLNSIKNISEKITIINDIAFQTNILALNAAVEAARAGEHGKGFAVVASEVRKLAERSKKAADEIIELSRNTLEVTEESDKLLESIVPEIVKTSKLVQEIAAASREQNSGADQVNITIQHLNDLTQQNASSSEELASSAEELSAQAENLQEIVSFFVTSQAHFSHKRTDKPSPRNVLTQKTSNKNILQERKTETKKTPASINDIFNASNTKVKSNNPKKEPEKKPTKGFNLKLEDSDNKDSDYETF